MNGRKEYCILAVATALAGGIGIDVDVAVAKVSVTKLRPSGRRRGAHFASQGQLDQELMA
jgi:hypothetical protein